MATEKENNTVFQSAKATETFLASTVKLLDSSTISSSFRYSLGKNQIEQAMFAFTFYKYFEYLKMITKSN